MSTLIATLITTGVNELTSVRITENGKSLPRIPINTDVHPLMSTLVYARIKNVNTTVVFFFGKEDFTPQYFSLDFNQESSGDYYLVGDCVFVCVQ